MLPTARREICYFTLSLVIAIICLDHPDRFMRSRSGGVKSYSACTVILLELTLLELTPPELTPPEQVFLFYRDQVR